MPSKSFKNKVIMTIAKEPSILLINIYIDVSWVNVLKNLLRTPRQPRKNVYEFILYFQDFQSLIELLKRCQWSFFCCFSLYFFFGVFFVFCKIFLFVCRSVVLRFYKKKRVRSVRLGDIFFFLVFIHVASIERFSSHLCLKKSIQSAKCVNSSIKKNKFIRFCVKIFIFFVEHLKIL